MPLLTTEERTYLEKEYDTVRTELRELKHCQLTYLTVSISATALIFGLLGKISTISNPGSFDATLLVITLIAPLAPLALLIPAGIIFFDKSITISRAVGYCRIIESLLLNRIDNIEIIGFENALSRWRDYPFEAKKEFLSGEINNKHKQLRDMFNKSGISRSGIASQAPSSPSGTNSGTISGSEIPNPIAPLNNTTEPSSDGGQPVAPPVQKSSEPTSDKNGDKGLQKNQFGKMLRLKTPLRYWMIVFYIFIGLSAVCSISSILIFLSLPKLLCFPFWIVVLSIIVCFFIIPIIIGFYTWKLFNVVSNLTDGKFSYDYNEQVWLDILKVDRTK